MLQKGHMGAEAWQGLRPRASPASAPVGQGRRCRLGAGTQVGSLAFRVRVADVDGAWESFSATGGRPRLGRGQNLGSSGAPRAWLWPQL